MNFNNKVIWITGASSGIGKALSIALSKHNCKLILSSRNENTLLATKNECNNSKDIQILPFDLADYTKMKAIVKKA
mgnify:FL=1